MNENGQNGCKVFASIAKFGETKFKPIRQENLINEKQSTKRTKIEENQQPKNRVNKFFKSRNSSSVLEETNKPKTVTRNITPIKNEPQFKEIVDKPLKIKIKKEKKEAVVSKKEILSPKKVTTVVEKQSPIKIKQNTKPIIKPISPLRSPPQNYSNQTRYSTRSRRGDINTATISNSIDNLKDNQINSLENNSIDNLTTNPINNQITNPIENKNDEINLMNNQLNNRIEQEKEVIHNDQINKIEEQVSKVTVSKSTRRGKNTVVEIKSVNENKPVLHQYGTRRSRKLTNNEEVVNNEDSNLLINNQINEVSIDQHQIPDDLQIEKNQMELEQNNFENLNCNPDEITFDEDNYIKDTLKDDFYSKTKQDEPMDFQFTSQSSSIAEINEQNFQSLSQPTYPTTTIDLDKPFSSSQPLPTSNVQQSTNPDKPVVLPQKKRFFSKTERKVQYNVKNFFSNDQANEVDEDANKQKDVKLIIEYDSDKLKKVKEAHKCAELGEAEHFDGEIKFYLSGIKDKDASPKVRCLNILGLTSQCLNKPELRMHLRAHDYMGKIIRALMDSPKDPNLALCAACLMFVYNQDRLTMDIDPNALSLMLELLETKADQDISQIDQKHKEKIIEMCQIMKTKGHGKYLKLNEFSAGSLAMETLLGLTSKRAGDWFKEELRTLKGIDYLMDAILNASSNENNLFMQQEGELNKIDRSLRVIENVTCQNKENQVYVINYKENSFIKRCMKLYELCRNGIIYCESTSANPYLSPLLSVLRVFTNLTSESQDGCAKIGDSIPEIFDIFLNSVFELPSFVVPDSRFDLIIFLLCLCLNLIESCDQLHNEFINNESQIKRLIVMLEERCDEAKKTEQQADDFLDSEETQRQLNAETINIDSILTDLVAKSGKHMEHTIIAACVSLLIGCGLKDNYKQVETVRKLLPNNSFTMMIDVITKLKEFSNLASIMTRSGIQRVESILSVLKHF